MNYSKITNLIKYSIPDIVRNQIHPRSTHVFCIGTPKSGTTSIAGIFDKHFRASHEPERVELISLIHKHYNKSITDADYVKWLIKRDKRVWLDLESNCFLGYKPELLYHAYPKSKYILSVRNPLSWLDSMINHTINYPPKSELVIEYWHSMFFQHEKYPHSKYDEILKKYNVYAVESYLRYWNKSIKSVLDAIPKEQLLTLNTKAIRSSANEIAYFLNIAPTRIDFQLDHLNKAPKKYNLLEQLDKSFLEQSCKQYCTEMVDKLALDYY